MVARSSAKAEFRAVAHGICAVMWIKRMLGELTASDSLPMKLYCDNKAAISIAYNPVLHDRTKHVEVDEHFIKEKLESGLICMHRSQLLIRLLMYLLRGCTRSNLTF